MARIAGYRERKLANYTRCHAWPDVCLLADEVDAHQFAQPSRAARLGVDRRRRRAQLGVVRRVAPDIGTTGTVASWDVRVPMACGDYHGALFRARDAEFYPISQRLLVDDPGDDVLAANFFSDTIGADVKMEIMLFLYLVAVIGVTVFIMGFVP